MFESCHLVSFCLLLWIFNLCLTLETGGRIQGGNYCEFRTFNATCREDEVIVMESAKYGRMKIGDCVVADLGYVGCYKDVLDLVDRRCSGRRTCEIRVPDEMLTNTKPCLQELKMYLEASYSCLKVAQTRESTCTKCSYIKPLEPSGFISSYHTQKSGCGSPDCPWRLEARPGQRINISLVNFAWTLPEKTKPSAHPPCKVYATIKEVSGSRGETICGENIRERHVYTSLTSAVELRIVGKSGGEQHLFQYEAIGCGEPVAPSGGWMEQRGDTVKVGCPGSKRAWILKCSDGLNWASSDAVPTACEGTTGSGMVASSELSGQMNIPYGTSIAIVVLVAVFVGTVILAVGLFIVKRKYTGRPQTQIPPYGPPSEQSYKDQHKIYHPNSLQSFGIHPKDMKSSEYLHDFDNQSQEGALTSSSGYAHIWERPLPEPMQLTDCPCSVADVRQSYSPMDGPPSYQHEGYQYNLVGGPTSVEIYRPATSDSMRRNTGNGLVYGNNTMARRELETGSFDPTRLGTTVEGKEPENARTQ